MTGSGANRRRAKVSVTVDPALLDAVDRYVQKQPSMDRSKVMERALLDWYRARQDEAMAEQFTPPEQASAEYEEWRKIRRAAAERKLRGRRR